MVLLVYAAKQKSGIIVTGIGKHRISINAKQGTGFSQTELMKALQDQLICCECGSEICVTLGDERPMKISQIGIIGQGIHVLQDNDGTFFIVMGWHCQDPNCIFYPGYKKVWHISNHLTLK